MISASPAVLDVSAERNHRIAPTSVAPITFFIRDDADWLVAHQRESDVDRLRSSNSREVLGFLKRRGASFLADVIRGTGKTKDDVEVALWELVATGLITADGFDNLRALIDPKPRANQRHGRDGRPRYSAGRWCLLFPSERGNREKVLEATCWMLLKRYGVVFREVLASESSLPSWREVLTLCYGD
jgi:ATP-dependent Lhr-like helicase